jgi:beta-lactamase class A
MTKPFQTTTFLFLLIFGQTFAQKTESLRQKIQQIVATKNATVGVAIMGPDKKDTVSVNADSRYPMQSVFKFHIALAVLADIDKRRFALNQKIDIPKKYLFPNFYSPIKDKYPNGVTLPLSEIMAYTVSKSDNIGCDALLRLIGGPRMVDDYFVKNKFKDIAIKINEEVMQSNWDLQYQNWTTPKAANNLLASFYDNKQKLLSKKSHAFIWTIMKQTETGPNRLKGQLPKGTVVAHKTGWSGTNKEGITAAVNDIGIVFLPDGRHFIISVFVTNSKENSETNEKIIANIAKAAWDYFLLK